MTFQLFKITCSSGNKAKTHPDVHNDVNFNRFFSKKTATIVVFLDGYGHDFYLKAKPKRNMSSVPVEHNWSAEQFDWPLQHQDGVVSVTNTSDKWSVGFDVQHFKPDEIQVNVAENRLLINCRHEARNDQHGSVTREIQRAYHLPEAVDTSTLKSHLTARGVLQITAQKKGQ
ncbi:Heat shock protein Hsp-12.2 [Aphelenchoides besseyi]|nr:Heat shock protein Hsp-12.2 [Aphelenchoides besseyi]